MSKKQSWRRKYPTSVSLTLSERGLALKMDQNILINLVGIARRAGQISLITEVILLPSSELQWSNCFTERWPTILIFLQNRQFNTNQFSECLFILMLGKVKSDRFLKISKFYYWSFKRELPIWCWLRAIWNVTNTW